MLNLLKKKHKDWKEKTDYVIEYVTSESNGTELYTFKDIANTSTHRGLCALGIIEEWDMRVTKAYLEGYLTRMTDILANPQTINLGDIYKMSEELKLRLQFIIPTEDIILKYASIIFFDKQESPYKYDEKYGKEKVERWKKDSKNLDFFFSLPIKNFLPLPNISKEDLQTCLLTVNLIGKDQITEMLSNLSPEQVRDGILQELDYQKSLLSTSTE